MLLIDGGLNFQSTHDYDRMADEEVRALRAKITLVSDPALVRRAGAVRVETGIGGTFDHAVTHVRGTAANPMTQDEVSAKAHDLMAPILGEARTGELIQNIIALETVSDCRDLRPLLSA